MAYKVPKKKVLQRMLFEINFVYKSNDNQWEKYLIHHKTHAA